MREETRQITGLHVPLEEEKSLSSGRPAHLYKQTDQHMIQGGVPRLFTLPCGDKRKKKQKTQREKLVGAQEVGPH